MYSNHLLRQSILAIISSAVVGLSGCNRNEVVQPQEEVDADIYAGGTTTVFIAGSNAFSTPAPNLSGSALARHLEGDRQFGQTFVTAPATVNGGLGPLFNNTSCESCHQGDGRGRPPFPGEEVTSMLIRISVPGSDEHGGPNPVPGFGGQLQQRAILGRETEGSVTVQWTEIPGSYGDGTTYSLRKPTIMISGRVPSGILTSARVAPPVFGLGLLEAVDEATILAVADENEVSHDNISGKPNYVWDESQQRLRLGRFGWKAGQPSLLQQSAGAYNQDIGVTTPYFPLENCHGTFECDTLIDDPEISSMILENVELYTQTLGVPARRNANDPTVKRGKQLFQGIRCNSCHVEQLHTGIHPTVSELSHQTIFPFTDLLLHDMGEGLADGRPEFSANGFEWRTPPLWGIGLTQVVNGHSFFLHDGRARSIEEAILWHSGEAASARELFRSLSSIDRAALLTFLLSL